MVSLPSSPALTIALGVLLLANPLYVDALHLDQPNSYRYEASEVTYDDGLERSIHVGGVDDEVACLRDDRPGRACALEYALLEQGGNVTVRISWGDFVAEYGTHTYRYAYLNGKFYAIEAAEHGPKSVLSLNRTSADEAMADMATPVERASPPIREAVRTGDVETRREIDGADQLIRDGDDYYVVYQSASRVRGSDAEETGRLLEFGVSLVGMAVGLRLVLRGQRRRVERETDRT